MKHLKLFEEFSLKDYAGYELKPAERKRILDELFELVTWPELFKKSPELWAIFIDACNLHEDEFEPDLIEQEFKDQGSTEEEKKEFYKRIEEYLDTVGQSQTKFDMFMNTEGYRNSGYWTELEGQTVEDYMDEFGVPRDVAAKIKSINDNVLYVEVEWTKIK